MKWAILVIVILIAPLPVAANHGWADMDICDVYKDKLPPGLTSEALPDAESHGAVLLNKHCTQCHNLPGPDRHSVSEWREVTSRMFMLMDVSNQFGGFMGRVDTIQPEDKQILLAYLERHATKVMNNTSTVGIMINERVWQKRIFALLPFMLLMGVGLLRWRLRF